MFWQKLGVEVPEEDYNKLRTVKEMLDYFSARISRSSAT
jgi:hypothetical protein